MLVEVLLPLGAFLLREILIKHLALGVVE